MDKTIIITKAITRTTAAESKYDKNILREVG